MQSYWGVEHGDEVSKAALPTKWNGMMQGIPKAKRAAGAKFNLGFSGSGRRAGGTGAGLQRSAQGPTSMRAPQQRQQLRPTPALPTRSGGRKLDWNRMRG